MAASRPERTLLCSGYSSSPVNPNVGFPISAWDVVYRLVYCAYVQRRSSASERGNHGFRKPAHKAHFGPLRGRAGCPAPHSKCGGRKPSGSESLSPPVLRYMLLGKRSKRRSPVRVWKAWRAPLLFPICRAVARSPDSQATSNQCPTARPAEFGFGSESACDRARSRCRGAAHSRPASAARIGEVGGVPFRAGPGRSCGRRDLPASAVHASVLSQKCGWLPREQKRAHNTAPTSQESGRRFWSR